MTEPRRTPTPRELDVLRLLADDRTLAQVAAELRLSPPTVRTHLANARLLARRHTQAGIVAWALRHGHID